MAATRVANVAVLVASLAFGIGALVNRIVTEPYMDEVFHIPQTLQYCEGHFDEWDDSITTFPGTYFLSLLACPFVPKLGAVALRGAMWLSYVLLFISAVAVSAAFGAKSPILRGLRIATLPTVAFFAVLLYTEVPSVLFLLLSCVCVQALPLPATTTWKSVLASLACSAAILCRQTNVIAVAFLLGYRLVLDCEYLYLRRQGVSTSGRVAAPSTAAVLRMLRREGACLLLPVRAPLLLPLLAFTAFYAVNGSVVLGHHERHAPVFHGAQFPYAVLAMAAFHLPECTSTGVRLWRMATTSLRSGVTAVISLAAASCIMLLLLQRFAMAHPFLLADNRHYSFYVWAKLLSKPWLRCCLALPAAIALLCLAYQVGKSRRSLIPAGYFAAVAASVMFTPLLEFRYFTPAIVLHSVFTSHSAKPSTDAVAVVVQTAATAGLLYVFLFHPFQWNDGSVARFMF